MAEEDIIFGKNRHFYGGIEPSNMTAFSVAVVDGAVRITAELPSDTIIDGQTLVSVAGAEIRRKTDEYPRDEFDGELIAKITASSTFVDSTADPTVTYYYAAFPYSTQGVYNTSGSAKISLNGPEPMVEFSATSAASKVTIVATLPDSVVGAVIRKSTDRYPVDETDGEAFLTITESGTYVDADVVADVTYYYSAFPYTASGAYNRDNVATNRLSILVAAYEYLFGYDLDTNDSDPDTRVTYPSDVDNYGYTPAGMNFSSSVFDYGSWNIAPGEKFMPRPCVLGYDGTVQYYLDPDNYTVKEDGVSASNVASTSLAGNAMMEWPKIYTKRWEDEDGIYHFRCSETKWDDDWDCWCNYDKNNYEIPHFYTRIYEGYVVSNVLRSISGQNPYPSSGIAISNYITYAQANSSEWYIEVLADYLLIQDLLVMMAKTTNCQAAYGNGDTKANMNTSTIIKTGTMDNRGLFWGTNADYVTGVKVFGMENWWGNMSSRIAGWVNIGTEQYVKITRGTHDGSTGTDYSTTSIDGYIKANSFSNFSSGDTYLTKFKTESYGRLPALGGGSSTTYECDVLHYVSSSTSSVFYMAVVSAYYSMASGAKTGVECGPFGVSFRGQNNAASASMHAALSCKPYAT